jgi:hypothetical protein
MTTTDGYIYSAMALIYDSDENLWCKSEQSTFDTGGSEEWIDFTFSAPSSLTPNAYYYLDIWCCNRAGAGAWVHRIDGSPINAYYTGTDVYDADPPSSLPSKTADASAKSYSIYCTYTMSGVSWYDTNWTHRRKITIDSSHVSGIHTDFPVMVTPSGLSDARSDGKDIVFTQSNGTTRIPCEIDGFTTGTGNIWVKVPSVTESSDTNIYIYYGEGNDHTDDSGYRPSGVWDDGFIFVSHMNDLTTSTVKDSTRYANNGNKYATNQPIENTRIIGIKGSSQLFESTGDDYISSQSESQYNVSSNFTFECWFNFSDPTDNHGYLCTRSESNQYHPFLFYVSGTQNPDTTHNLKVHMATYDATGSLIADTISEDTDYYLAYTFESGASYESHAYLDASEVLESTGWGGSIGQRTYPLCIGGRPDGNRSFSGQIDEVRLHKWTRTVGWIKTAYSTMSSPSTFYTLYSEEDAPAAGGEYTTFQTCVGTSLAWAWDSGQFNVDDGMRATSDSPTTWSWAEVSSSTSYYYPSGSPLGWVWAQGSS